MKKIFISLLIFLFFVSCNPQNDLNKGYFIEQDTEIGDKLIIVREDTVFYRDIGKNKVLQKGVIVQYHTTNGAIDTVKLWGGSKVISSHVNKICFDSVFVLVEQNPLDSIFGKVKKQDNRLIRPDEPDLNIDATEMIRNSTFKQYWIINKIKDDIYGPLTKREFKQKCKELYVSKILIFEFEK